MLLLVSGATRSVDRHQAGHLIVPRAWNKADALNLKPRRWAMDNGAFSGFDEGAFVRMLEQFQDGPECLFVVAPDVVADAASTRARWPFWSRLIRGLGFPPAFVAQDGLEPHQVPWQDIGALFVGGTTEYKESPAARSLCGYAKAKGIWVHWGRVNGKARYKKALIAGADSFDGSGFSIAPDTNIPLPKQWHADIQQQPGFL